MAWGKSKGGKENPELQAERAAKDAAEARAAELEKSIAQERAARASSEAKVKELEGNIGNIRSQLGKELESAQAKLNIAEKRTAELRGKLEEALVKKEETGEGDKGRETQERIAELEEQLEAANLQLEMMGGGEDDDDEGLFGDHLNEAGEAKEDLDPAESKGSGSGGVDDNGSSSGGVDDGAAAAALAAAALAAENESRAVAAESKAASAVEAAERLQKELEQAQAEAERLSSELEGIHASYEHDPMAQRLAEMQDKLNDKSTELVAQGEKNFKLFEKLQRYKDEGNAARDELMAVRKMLVKEIAGPQADATLYQNVSFDQLVRLRSQSASYNTPAYGRAASVINQSKELQRLRSSSPPFESGTDEDGESKSGSGQANDEDGNADAVAEGSTLLASGSLPSLGATGGSDSLFSSSVRQAEAEMRVVKAQNKRLVARLEEAEALGRAGATALESVEQMKQRNDDLARRLRSEKDGRRRVETELDKSGERVRALSQHIEKLMVHLKHEAASKTKAADLAQRDAREVKLLRSRNAVLARKNKARERMVTELREGSRILEDQLRLMDEKYIELRTKLDWTRASSQYVPLLLRLCNPRLFRHTLMRAPPDTAHRREVKRIQKDANRLRAKFALAAGTDPTLLREQLGTPLGGSRAGTPGMGARGGSMGKSASESVLPRPNTTPLPPSFGANGSASATNLALPKGTDADGSLPAIESLVAEDEEIAYRPRGTY